YGMTTATHAHGVEGVKRAIIGGITSTEHETLMDKQTNKQTNKQTMELKKSMVLILCLRYQQVNS
ncbi:MAG: imidazolonepropionase-like amidohydrolase, partial [Saprospiraceae bacterium]